VNLTGETPVVQIHPTRRCNLNCLHCYSESGPSVTEELPLEVVLEALTDAHGEGYRYVAVSGGEPLLYPYLREVLVHARRLDMRASITTNGTIAAAERLGPIADLVDAVAVSVDGIPSSHDRMRGAGAFSRMVDKLEVIKGLGRPFGFIVTLTYHNVHELEWVAAFALEQGARFLQVHPLESEGNARKHLVGSVPDDVELGFASIEALRLADDYRGRLAIQVDVVARETMRAHPALWLDDLDDVATRPLAEVVSPLVIETSGRATVVRYGFDPSFALGNVRESSLAEIAAGWKRKQGARFRAVVRAGYRAATAPDAPLFLNWYEWLDGVARARPPSGAGTLQPESASIPD
jgi:MoaA/NifB/PqqE/SkfB family radical SAM enzyme